MKKKTLDPKQPFNFRPRDGIASRLVRLCEELGYEKPQALNYCAEAILDMIEADNLEVPSLVKLGRMARANDATLVSPRDPFPGSERRDRKDVSLGYPEHADVPRHGQISAGRPTAFTSPEPTGTINVPAGVARVADFAMEVSGDSMEPLIHAGEIAVFRKAEMAGNGQIVAALVEGEMLLKKFTQKNGGPDRLESLNPKYLPIPLTRSIRIQGVFEGKFSLH